MTHTSIFSFRFLENKKAMEEVFSDPLTRATTHYFQTRVNGGTRLHVAKKSQATSFDQHSLVAAYTIVLCYVTIHLGGTILVK